MDINTLLDFAEELLNMYGYETRRNVGLVGAKIVTALLEKETGTLKEELPKAEEKELVYKIDLIAEKKDIERPFGRIIVNYKRGSGPLEASDVKMMIKLAEVAEAYSGLLLTVTGATDDAHEIARQLGVINIITPEKIEQLLGKAMTKERWWFNAPAFPVRWSYDNAMWKLKWFFEKMMFINYETIMLYNKEFAYEPYWKFSYYIAPKEKGKEIKEGFFALNALTGEIDTWCDIQPEMAVAVPGKGNIKKVYVNEEAIYNAETMVTRTKIKKPKLPPDVHFEVFRPVMEKHEAKLAALQWIAYIENAKPEDIVLVGRELVYYPWWKFYYFYRPIVKNAWEDTEKMAIKMSGVYGDIFNQWKNYKLKRDIIYYFMEKSLIRVLGRDRYVNFMRKVTLGVASLWWNYHLVLRPQYIAVLMLAITAITIYAFITATIGLSLILGIILVFLFMGPGYAFFYVLKDYLEKYPAASYAHPQITKKDFEAKIKPIEDAESAIKDLEQLEKEGKLTEKEKKELEKIHKKHVKELVKKVKKGRGWFG